MTALKVKREDTGLVALAGESGLLSNAETNEGANGIIYRKVDGVVYLRVVCGGVWSNGKTFSTTGQLVGTLPEGFRPSIRLDCMGFVPGAANAGHLVVHTNGDIYVALNSGSGKYFRAMAAFPV